MCRLQEPNRNALVHDAQFIGDTVDDVLNHLIDATLLNDHDFMRRRAGQPPQSVTAAAGRDGMNGSAIRTDRHA
jgi:hypothetical protein